MPNPTRQHLAEKFSDLSWFQNTKPDLQKELLSLPEDFDAFLEDLAGRPVEINELDVLSLQKIGFGHFLIFLVFEVRSTLTNQVFTYEYTSWKTGSRPGAKGIIFLEKEGKVTHFLVSRSHSFSTATENYEAIGGLYLHPFENRLENLPKKLEQEICFHLGVDTLKFTKIINLGLSHPDLGMSNNTSLLFAAFVDISEAPIGIKKDFRATHKPVGFELEILPIAQFKPFLQKTNDNYFLSAAARIMTSQEIDFESHL